MQKPQQITGLILVIFLFLGMQLLGQDKPTDSTDTKKTSANNAKDKSVDTRSQNTDAKTTGTVDPHKTDLPVDDLKQKDEKSQSTDMHKDASKKNLDAKDKNSNQPKQDIKTKTDEKIKKDEKGASTDQQNKKDSVTTDRQEPLSKQTNEQKPVTDKKENRNYDTSTTDNKNYQIKQTKLNDDKNKGLDLIDDKGRITSDEQITALLFGSINAGFGLFTPVSAYSDAYASTWAYQVQATLDRYNFLHLSPAMGFSYARLTSKDRPGYVDSTMGLTGITIGAVYQRKLTLPTFLSRYAFLQKPLTVYARIADGITQVVFESDTDGPITEYINTLEFNVGFTYPIIWHIHAGIECGYKMIFTAGDTLQGYTIGFTLGVRI